MPFSTEQRRVSPRQERFNERDTVREEISARHLGEPACEIIVRIAMQRTPPALAQRARTLLLRYFSPRPWTINDESALAALVGRGNGWHETVLDTELVIRFGWRGGGFKVMCGRVAPTDPDGAATRPRAGQPTGPSSRAVELADVEATIARLANNANSHVMMTLPLASTFDASVVPETTHDARIVTFLTGMPTPSGAKSWVRRSDVATTGVAAAILEAIPTATRVMCESGSYSVEVNDADDWMEWLGATISLLIHIAGTPRQRALSTRTAGRLREEFAALDVHTSKAILRIRHALIQRDPLERELAVGAIGVADPFAAPKVWRTAIDDSARNVRRAAVAAIAAARNDEHRELLERATHDVDACTRFHAARGLARIGAQPSSCVLEPLLHDTDARVKVVTIAALRGKPLPV